VIERVAGFVALLAVAVFGFTVGRPTVGAGRAAQPLVGRRAADPVATALVAPAAASRERSSAAEPPLQELRPQPAPARAPDSRTMAADLQAMRQRLAQATAPDRPVIALELDTLAIAVLLAVRGRAEVPAGPPGPDKFTAEPTCLRYRDCVVRFPAGEFPEHDDLRARLQDRQGGRREFLPPALLWRIERRSDEAAAALARRLAIAEPPR